MEWYNKLYVGPAASNRKRKIIRKIKRNKIQLGVYVITLPLNDANSLEIYPSYILCQDYYIKHGMYVIGIALGKDEALELVTRILMDCYEQTNQYLVRKMIEIK